jgi:hypothetical protein
MSYVPPQPPIAKLEYTVEQKTASKYASRKFSFSAGAFLFACIFLTWRYITSDQWVEITKWLVGLYMVGNVGAVAAGNWNASKGADQ